MINFVKYNLFDLKNVNFEKPKSRKSNLLFWGDCKNLDRRVIPPPPPLVKFTEKVITLSPKFFRRLGKKNLLLGKMQKNT